MLRSLAITIVSVVAGNAPSIACDFCINLGDAFSVSHPRSIDIALATRRAIEDGLVSNEVAITAGDMKIDGNANTFSNFLSLLDTFELYFNIVTP